MTAEPMNDPARIAVKAKLAGCEVTIEVSARAEAFKERLGQILTQLTEMGAEPLIEAKPPGSGDESVRTPLTDEEGPLSSLSRELDVSVSDLRRVLGIKGDTVQLYKAAQYSLSDAICIIGLAYEKGLGRNGMSFDVFAALLSSNHVKSKTPLSTLCFNLIRDGRIDKRAYENGRVVLLTPSGEEQAAKAIKKMLTGKPAAK